MPFGTATTRFGDGRRERFDPGGVAAINGWRARFGIPAVTGIAVFDPAGAVQTAERSQRLGDAATATRNVALAIKVAGVITGQEIIKQVGKAVAEGAKVLAQQAATLIQDLPEDIESAMLQEMRHALLAHHAIRADADLAAQWGSAALQHFDDASMLVATAPAVTADQLAGQLRSRWPNVAESSIQAAVAHARSGGGPVGPPLAARLAVFLPIYRHPAIRHFIGSAAARSRLDTLTGLIRSIPNMAVIAQQVRPPLDAASQAALDVQLQAVTRRNRLHAVADPFLRARDPWFSQRQRLQALVADQALQRSRVIAAAAIAAQEIPQTGRQLEENQATVSAATAGIATRRALFSEG